LLDDIYKVFSVNKYPLVKANNLLFNLQYRRGIVQLLKSILGLFYNITPQTLLVEFFVGLGV
jgi:hypothetical protein